MPTVQWCGRNLPWSNPQMSEIGKWLGLCQQPGLMVESENDIGLQERKWEIFL